LSAVAALRHFRKPEVEVETGDDGKGAGPVILHSDEREPTPLPLHHTPLTVTFALYSDPSGATTKVSALIDPTFREELVMNGTSTFSFNKYGEICSLDFPGGCELKPSQLVMCAKLGKQKCVELCDVLEKSLSEANEKAAAERMDRLRRSTGFGNGKVPIPEVPTNAPFVERGELMEVDQEDLSEIGSKQADAAAAIAAAEEESYRIQALDYAQGHVAAKVKENDDSRKKEGARRPKSGAPIFGGSLMSAMLKSAGNVEESSTQIQVEKEKKNASLPIGTEEADVEGNEISSAKEENKTQLSKSVNTESTQVIGIDSDDEEADTMVLHSEFGSVSLVDESKEAEHKESQKRQKVVKPKSQVDNDDVDLSMALKKKKSKKSKKKK
jgi:exosome complex component RRP45